MPITSPLPPSHTTQEEFAQLDYLVMRHAFESQNQLGRLCDELIYQNDLAARLRAAGLPVQTEVPITVTCRDFAKTYSLDLVVADAGIYELKTALGLIGEPRRSCLTIFFCAEPTTANSLIFGPHRLNRDLSTQRLRTRSDASLKFRRGTGRSTIKPTRSSGKTSLPCSRTGDVGWTWRSILKRWSILQEAKLKLFNCYR